MFTLSLRFIAFLVLTLLLSTAARGIDVLTYANDTMRSGANTTETILNQSNVNSAQFGKLYARNVDGIMYAQPLYASSITRSAAMCVM